MPKLKNAPLANVTSKTIDNLGALLRGGRIAGLINRASLIGTDCCWTASI